MNWKETNLKGEIRSLEKKTNNKQLHNGDNIWRGLQQPYFMKKAINFKKINKKKIIYQKERGSDYQRSQALRVQRGEECG